MGISESECTFTQHGGKCSDLTSLAELSVYVVTQSCFTKAWSIFFPWVVEVQSEGVLCRLCRKHNRCPQKAVVG